MAFDPTKLPPVLPVSVPRVEPDGTPSTYALQSEEVMRGFLRDSIVDISVETDTNAASIAVETDARIDGDTSLAGLLIDAEARATGGDASAQMRVLATASPAGYSASYSVRLRSSGSNYPVGADYRLSSGGLGSIELTAQAFYLTDPSIAGGAPGNLLTYSSTLGALVFGVPILARTIDIANAAVSKPRVASSSSTSTVQIIASDYVVGSELLILAVASPVVGYTDSSVTAVPTNNSYIQINVDSTLLKQTFSPISLDTRTTGGSGTVAGSTCTLSSVTNVVWWQAQQTKIIAHFTTTGTGHTIDALWKSGAGGTNMPNADWEMIVWEFKR